MNYLQSRLDYLHVLRAEELKAVLAFLPPKCRILEIGGGTGYQAKMLSQHGYEVHSIDIETSVYNENKVFTVQEFDGHHIPFDNDYFDVIFSSSVLEHIPHLVEFSSEMKRVLKASGSAIHIVPSGNWRIWTTLSHYLFILKLAWLFLKKDKKKPSEISEPSKILENKQQTTAKNGLKDKLKKVLLSQRHGEKGNTFSEIYYFSRRYWSGWFQQQGWEIVQYKTNGLFYTMNLLFARIGSLRMRRLLSKFLGSSGHIFVLRKNIPL